MTSRKDVGMRILLIEDDYHQAQELARLIEGAGAMVVGPIGRRDAAERIIRARGFDLAILDINLGQGPDYDLAFLLRDMDRPFLFLTGYGRVVVPEEFRHILLIEKPVDGSKLLSAIRFIAKPHTESLIRQTER